MEAETPETGNTGPLTILVCIKQVPLLSALRFDPETRRIVREGVPLEINELDIYALTEAIRLRDLHGGEVIAMTMGPPQAREALATALAMGADRAIHLNDRAFAGADTAATARALALAIRQYFQNQAGCDLILCGRHSIDAETAQVGPEIAEMLDLPQVSAVQRIDLQRHNGTREAIVTRETDEGNETLIIPLPALLTTVEKLNEGIWPDEHAIRAASEQAGDRIQVISAAELQVEPHLLGQPGSPTWVAEVSADPYAREGRVIAENDPEKAIELLIADLEAHGLLQDTARADHTASSAPLRRQNEPLPGKALWVIAERSSYGPRALRRITFELLGKSSELAATLQGELAAVLIGAPGVTTHAATLAAYGAERVYIVEDATLEHYTTDGYTAVMAELIQRYQPAVVLMGSTAEGRDLAPRIAARLNLGLTGDCIDLGIDEQQRLVQYKPAFGGSILSSILSNTTPAMATLRPGMLSAITPDFSRVPTIEQVTIKSDIGGQIRARIVGREQHDTGVAELESARTIIGVGMGMGEPDQYQSVYQLAELLGAAIGATRNVTDKGWLPKQKQIGLTGRAVAPQLYIALGVRGAAEHIAGIRKAGYVLSINKNKRAAIFKHSDLGVMGDVHVLLPLLIEQLRRRRL
ncbi:MAG TPA: FAD-binding protein [Ktedonosporobacter sp.]|nr:FAD-binding protein [Ktedonosporobacter sp.]